MNIKMTGTKQATKLFTAKSMYINSTHIFTWHWAYTTYQRRDSIHLQLMSNTVNSCMNTQIHTQMQMQMTVYHMGQIINATENT